MKILIVFLTAMFPVLAQSSLPPASLSHLQDSALVYFRVPAEIPETPVAGTSGNLLRLPFFCETCAEPNGREKIPNREKRDARIKVGSRNLFAAAVTFTFPVKRIKALKLKR